MGSRGHRDKAFGDVQTVVKAEAINIGEASGDTASRCMSHVQEHMVAAAFSHFADMARAGTAVSRAAGDHALAELAAGGALRSD